MEGIPCHSNKAFVAKYTYLKWLEKYLIEQEANQYPELWNAFDNAMWPLKHPYLNKVMATGKKIVKKAKRKKKGSLPKT